MIAPINAILDALRTRDVQTKEFGLEPGRSQLMILFAKGTPGPQGIEAFHRAVVVEYGDGKWIVGPPSGDPSFERQSFTSEGAALAATLTAIGRDA